MRNVSSKCVCLALNGSYTRQLETQPRQCLPTSNHLNCQGAHEHTSERALALSGGSAISAPNRKQLFTSAKYSIVEPLSRTVWPDLWSSRAGTGTCGHNYSVSVRPVLRTRVACARVAADRAASRQISRRCAALTPPVELPPDRPVTTQLPDGLPLH